MTDDDITGFAYPKHLSASQIKTFYQCPFKWLAKAAGLKAKPTDMSHLHFGTAFHECMEDYYEKRVAFEDMENHLREKLTKVANSKTKAKVEPSIANWLAWESHQRLGDEDCLVELTFNDHIGEGLPTMKGAIDLYVPSRRHIADWKTGKSDAFFKYGKPYPFEFFIQGKMYHWALENRGHDVEHIEFLFTPTGERGCVSASLGHDWLIETVTNMMKYVDAGVFARNPGPLCSWCEYQHHCGDCE